MKTVRQLAAQRFSKVIPAFVAFAGGLDQETIPIALGPGFCRASQNYECDIAGGYSRVKGYERFDGQASPSDANYAVLPVDISGSFAAGDTITGATSAATADVIAVVEETEDAGAYLVITKITGTFVDAEDLTVSAVVEGTTTAAATIDGASTPLLHAQYKNLAADAYRADIEAVPGEGGILGGFRYNGVTYALRNNVGSTAAVLHKSSGSGWAAVDLGRKLAFTSGGAFEIEEGDTITGATSGATAVVTRVMLESGTWAGGTAAGKLIFAAQTGTFQAENLNVGANLNVATIAGDSDAITLQPGGRLRTVLHNFSGDVNEKRVYGADGVNQGFEFDGTVFCPITTGMTDDTPDFVYVHMEQLFFAFGPSVQHSAPGTPYIWSVVLGAGEIGMGDNVTGFKSMPGSEDSGALAIFTRNRTKILYGTGVANWKLVEYREELGAYADTVQEVAQAIFLDDLGITNFQTAQAFGNFSHSALSARIRTWLNAQRVKAVASCVVRNKNQYRLFFNDQYALFTTMLGNKPVGMMPVFLAHTPTCAWSAEESDGSETVWFGASNGMVYQMEMGTSFDGDAIEHYLYMAYHFLGSARVLKELKGGALEVRGSGYAQWFFTYELGYTSALIPQAADQSFVTSFSPLLWDAPGVVWDAQTWDSVTLQPVELDIRGSAENISLVIRGSSDYHEAVRFSGAHIHYIPRRLMH